MYNNCCDGPKIKWSRAIMHRAGSMGFVKTVFFQCLSDSTQVFNARGNSAKD